MNTTIDFKTAKTIRILYGEHDNLTSIETVSAFAKRYHADLTVMPGGEHWFHIEEQMQFLDQWIREHSLTNIGGR